MELIDVGVRGTNNINVLKKKNKKIQSINNGDKQSNVVNNIFGSLVLNEEELELSGEKYNEDVIKMSDLPTMSLVEVQFAASAIKLFRDNPDDLNHTPNEAISKLIQLFHRRNQDPSYKESILFDDWNRQYEIEWFSKLGLVSHVKDDLYTLTEQGKKIAEIFEKMEIKPFDWNDLSEANAWHIKEKYIKPENMVYDFGTNKLVAHKPNDVKLNKGAANYKIVFVDQEGTQFNPNNKTYGTEISLDEINNLDTKSNVIRNKNVQRLVNKVGKVVETSNIEMKPIGINSNDVILQGRCNNIPLYVELPKDILAYAKNIEKDELKIALSGDINSIYEPNPREVSQDVSYISFFDKNNKLIFSKPIPLITRYENMNPEAKRYEHLATSAYNIDEIEKELNKI